LQENQWGHFCIFGLSMAFFPRELIMGFETTTLLEFVCGTDPSQPSLEDLAKNAPPKPMVQARSMAYARSLTSGDHAKDLETVHAGFDLTTAAGRATTDYAADMLRWVNSNENVAAAVRRKHSDAGVQIAQQSMRAKFGDLVSFDEKALWQSLDLTKIFIAEDKKLRGRKSLG
jgi:hypothetical protein